MKKLIYLITLFSTPIFAAQTIECDFTSYSNKDGNHKDTLKLTFLINNSDKKTYVKHGEASSEVEYTDGYHGKTFVGSVASNGIVYITTINKIMNAVHSRHQLGMLDGVLQPKQYYGSCTE